jgi:quinol monooxygenase YgiN
MKLFTTTAAILVILLLTAGCQTAEKHSATHSQRLQQQMEAGMLVRISEVEIHAEQVGAYKAILQEEAAASVQLEPGVVSIFPMQQTENPTAIRILEIYADREAYESHLKTPHFQKYKTTTLHMVKSLKLVDMNALDAGTMRAMFTKLKIK